MIGPFSPGDSLRIYRLQRRGISFDVQQDLMSPRHPLREAWLALLTQHAMGQPTYVLYDPHEGEAFIQLRYRPHQAAADVVYAAPSLSESPQSTGAWSRMLNSASVEAARQGIQRIFASLPASGDEGEVFHQAGFTLYAEEFIYHLSPGQVGANQKPTLEMRRQQIEDWPALQKLCVAITPQRVRQAEGGIAPTTGWDKECQRYVMPIEGGEDVGASLTICVGSQAHWLRLLVHPDYRQQARDLVQWGIAILSSYPAKGVYCGVRQYEGGVREALEAVGFESGTTRALMAKQTVALIKPSVAEAAAVLKSSAELVPPTYRINGEPDLTNPDSRLAAETRSD